MSAAPLSRRRFLARTSALACACVATPGLAFASGSALRPPERNQVRLGAGPMRDQLEHQHRLFMGLDDDRLLKPFRQRAGQSAPGEDMGGWYDETDDFHIDVNDWSTANWHGYIPGHSFGQWLSGLARIYAATGDAATKARVETLVGKYAETISPAFFDGYTLPAYTYDKLVIGLVDAWRFAGIEQARAALDATTDAALPFMPAYAETRDERRARPHTTEAEIWDEPYTLPENLFLAWKAGMGERYRDLAIRYLQDGPLFDPLARGESPFAGKHAYSHVNALNSAVEAYLVTGSEKHLTAARNGMAMVEAQSWATGGWGPNEELVGAGDLETPYRMLSETHRSFETPCGVYGHFKIARHLLALTGDSRYADGMERLLHNAILGAKPTRPDGETFYYADYSQEGRKVFRGEAWPCCSGTFVQLAADYGISGWMVGDAAVHAVLYAPSTVELPFGRGVSVTQTTDYPYENTVRLEISAAAPTRFALKLRIPAWAGPETRVTVNGQPFGATPTPGAFHAIERDWRDGDVVELTLDQPLRLEPLNTAHPEMAALMTGPMVLFPIQPGDGPVSRETLLAARREGRGLWRIDGPAGPVALKPFPAIGDEAYRTYSRLSDV